ncbi:MAG TPA: hypothetical protein VID68_08250 [Solirubrobacteraceae bacterium]|jgi:hypothetical protein
MDPNAPAEDRPPLRGVERRIAQNEALFRDVNESIARGHWPGEPEQPLALRCECGNLNCNMLVEVSGAEYEQIRSDPRRFVLVPGHEIATVETVIERGADHVVVEKVGEAGKVARKTDPR